MQSDNQWPWWLYVIPFLSCLIIWSNYASESHQIEKMKHSVDVNSYPVLSTNEFLRRIDLLEVKINNPKVKTPKKYFEALAEKRSLDMAFKRFGDPRTRFDHLQFAELAKAEIRLKEIHISKYSLNSYNTYIHENFTKETIDSARENYLDPVLAKYNPSADIVVHRNFSFSLGYLLSILFFAIPFFVIRLQRLESRIAIEFHRIVSWSLIWPIGIFNYPGKIDWEQQYRSHKQFVAAVFSILISIISVQIAHAKPKIAQTKYYYESVTTFISTAKELSFLDPPSPQILPTLNIGGIKVNAFGWAHLTDSTTGQFANNTRARGTVDFYKKTRLFFQGNFGNLLETSNDFTVDQLWISRVFDSGIEVTGGRLLLKAATSTLPPFLQETITSPGIPSAFFANGIAVSGPVTENWSVAADITGDSRVSVFSPDQFGRLQFSASITRKTPTGFLRSSVQRAGSKMLKIFDMQYVKDRHLIRGAIHHQLKFGGYVLYFNQTTKNLGVFAQLRHAKGKNLGVIGTRININPNFDITGEIRTDGMGFRLQYRF